MWSAWGRAVDQWAEELHGESDCHDVMTAVVGSGLEIWPVSTMSLEHDDEESANQHVGTSRCAPAGELDAGVTDGADKAVWDADGKRSLFKEGSLASTLRVSKPEIQYPEESAEKLSRSNVESDGYRPARSVGPLSYVVGNLADTTPAFEHSGSTGYFTAYAEQSRHRLSSRCKASRQEEKAKARLERSGLRGSYANPTTPALEHSRSAGCFTAYAEQSKLRLPSRCEASRQSEEAKARLERSNLRAPSREHVGQVRQRQEGLPTKQSSNLSYSSNRSHAAGSEKKGGTQPIDINSSPLDLDSAASSAAGDSFFLPLLPAQQIPTNMEAVDAGLMQHLRDAQERHYGDSEFSAATAGSKTGMPFVRVPVLAYGDGETVCLPPCVEYPQRGRGRERKFGNRV